MDQSYLALRLELGHSANKKLAFFPKRKTKQKTAKFEISGILGRGLQK
jgi:hypothetical protein